MVHKDGSFNSAPFQCKKVEWIMSVLYNSVQEEEVHLFSFFVNYPFIHTLSPGGTLHSPKWGLQVVFAEQKGLGNLIYKE